MLDCSTHDGMGDIEGANEGKGRGRDGVWFI